MAETIKLTLTAPNLRQIAKLLEKVDRFKRQQHDANLRLPTQVREMQGELARRAERISALQEKLTNFFESRDQREVILGQTDDLKNQLAVANGKLETIFRITQQLSDGTEREAQFAQQIQDVLKD